MFVTTGELLRNIVPQQDLRKDCAFETVHTSVGMHPSWSPSMIRDEFVLGVCLCQGHGLFLHKTQVDPRLLLCPLYCSHSTNMVHIPQGVDSHTGLTRTHLQLRKRHEQIHVLLHDMPNRKTKAGTTGMAKRISVHQSMHMGSQYSFHLHTRLCAKAMYSSYPYRAPH